MIRQELSMRVRDARIKGGLSVKELAEKANVSASYIYAIESGARGTHIDKLSRIANALGISLYDIWSEVNS